MKWPSRGYFEQRLVKKDNTQQNTSDFMFMAREIYKKSPKWSPNIFDIFTGRGKSSKDQRRRKKVTYSS